MPLICLDIMRRKSRLNIKNTYEVGDRDENIVEDT